MNSRIPICMLAAGLLALSANAETKLMRIHYSNGTSETKPVTDVVKITFEDEGETPPGPGVITPGSKIDMGVSVLWSSFNMGADTPEGYGNFYAYGEIEPKTEYTYDNYQWRYPDYNDWDCDEWEKYFKLGATFTGTNYDVAHVKWGDKWRVPTRDEWNELIDNCTWQWTGINGVTGCLATSKTTGNTLFFPAAGNMVDAEHTHDQLGCFYWTSTEFIQQDISQECRNYRANMDATNHAANGYDYPEVGFSIRPVYGDVPAHPVDACKVPSGDEIVDLGLSVKWASFNIGADNSGDVGNFYCWGEVYTKQYSHTYNYKWYDPITDSIVDIADNIAGTEYDAARHIWGDDWRLPTDAEWQELLDNCTWVLSGSGYTVTGPNGNSIYLPACGFMTYKGAPRASGDGGYYMSSGADTRINAQGQKMLSNARCLKFPKVGYNLQEPRFDYFAKAGGVQIRPVHE